MSAPVRALLREIMPLSQANAARRLARRAQAARDARRFDLAAALYQEALRLNPDHSRLRVQCGHMLKEAGDLAGAAEQYEQAARDRPNDADLALQIGHVHKLAGQPALAAGKLSARAGAEPGMAPPASASWHRSAERPTRGLPTPIGSCPPYCRAEKDRPRQPTVTSCACSASAGGGCMAAAARSR